MRICLVYQGEYPPGERIEKTAATLRNAGHQVFLLCNNYGGFPRREERTGDVYTVRLEPTFKSRAINTLLKFPVFFNPLWAFQLFATAQRFRIDAIAVIDIPLAPAALAVARILGIRVVMDMWENYPEALRGWAGLDWKRRILKNPDAARLVERWVTPRMDHIFTVVDEQKERLVSDGIPAEKVSVVTNGVDLEAFTNGFPPVETPLDREPDAYKLLYVGFIEVERGLDDIIRALRLVRSKIPSIRFYVVGGTTTDYPQYLERLVRDEGVTDLVRFIPAIPFSAIPSYIAKSDLCTVPHVYNDFINTTIPNKIFQYMALSKPLLVSNAKPLARIVRECDCGFIFRSRDPEDAAAAILKAYEARDDAQAGRRGRACVERKYTWDIVSEELVRVYANLGVASGGHPAYESQQ